MGVVGKDGPLCKREILIGYLPYAPQPGIEPAAQVWALARNQTRNLSVYRKMLQLTESYWLGLMVALKK